MIRSTFWLVIALVVPGIVLAPLFPSRLEDANANLDAVLRVADGIGKQSAVPGSVVKARDKVLALIAQPRTPGGQFAVNPADRFAAARLVQSEEAALSDTAAALTAASAEITARGTALKASLPKSDWTEWLKSVLEAARDLVSALIWPALAAFALYFAFTTKGQDWFGDLYDTPPNVAEFALTDGTSRILPFIILPEGEQAKLIEAVGLSHTPRSPKLRHGRLVTGYRARRA